MDEGDVARALCAGRLAIGAALLVAPDRAARAWTADEGGHGLRMVARAAGGRDVALALGALAALRRGAGAGPWLTAGAAADASDAFATLAAFGHLPGRRWFVAGAALGGAALGLRLAARMPRAS